MKTCILIIIITISNSVLAQEQYTNTLIDTFLLRVNKNEINKEETILAGQNPFIAKYGLADLKGIHAKTLYEVELMAGPISTSGKTGVVIKKNEIVYLYKYFTANKYWAIEYDHNWGFVKDTLIIAVSESSSD